jgi:hypothetical protein
MVRCDVCAQEHEATYVCQDCGVNICSVLAIGPFGHSAMRATHGHQVVPLDVHRDDNVHVLAQCRKRADDLLRAALNVAQARVGVDAYHVQAMSQLHSYFDEVRVQIVPGIYREYGVPSICACDLPMCFCCRVLHCGQ